jgi:hypothetical protein
MEIYSSVNQMKQSCTYSSWVVIFLPPPPSLSPRALISHFVRCLCHLSHIITANISAPVPGPDPAASDAAPPVALSLAPMGRPRPTIVGRLQRRPGLDHRHPRRCPTLDHRLPVMPPHPQLLRSGPHQRLTPLSRPIVATTCHHTSAASTTDTSTTGAASTGPCFPSSTEVTRGKGDF